MDKIEMDKPYKCLKFLSLLVVTCPLLITFSNSLDPYQDRQNVGPDLDPNCFDSLILLLKDFFLSKQMRTKA